MKKTHLYAIDMLLFFFHTVMLIMHTRIVLYFCLRINIIICECRHNTADYINLDLNNHDFSFKFLLSFGALRLLEKKTYKMWSLCGYWPIRCTLRLLKCYRRPILWHCFGLNWSWVHAYLSPSLSVLQKSTSIDVKIDQFDHLQYKVGDDWTNSATNDE